MMLSTIELVRPATEALAPRTFGGWALDISCLLEAACPSTLASFFCASSLRRQAIFCALAELDRDRPEDLAGRLRKAICTGSPAANGPFEKIAQSLLAGSPKLVLEAVYGCIPGPGLLGILRRIGSDPFTSPTTYRALFDLFARPEHRQRAKVLSQVSGIIAENTIEIVRALSPNLLHTEIATRLWEPKQAQDLQQALALAKDCAPDLTDESIQQSIERLAPSKSISTWVEGLLRRATRFPHRPPVEDDHEIRGLHTAEALRDAGRRYSNCAASRVAAIALGTGYLLEWQPSPLIIELAALSGGQWLLEGVWGPKNRQPTPDVVQAIHRKLRGYGILLPRQDAEGAAQMPIARLLGVYSRFTSFELADLEQAVAAA